MIRLGRTTRDFKIDWYKRWWRLASLSVYSEGPPPESGPNPQGLENLKILCYKIGVLNGRNRKRTPEHSY